MTYTIQKFTFSSRPWRLVKDGAEVYVKMPFDHPTLGPTVIGGPVCADTKAELVEKVLAFLEMQAERIKELERERDVSKEIARENLTAYERCREELNALGERFTAVAGTLNRIRASFDAERERDLKEYEALVWRARREAFEAALEMVCPYDDPHGFSGPPPGPRWPTYEDYERHLRKQAAKGGE